jgi:hypothetical protein
MIWQTLRDLPPDVREAYVLRLNPMRGNTEDLVVIACSDSVSELQAMLDNEVVEPYNEPGINDFSYLPTTWLKNYRKDGPLEWCNPPSYAYSGAGIVRVRREGWVIG